MSDETSQTRAMPFWVWIAAAFAGAFLINSIPHTVMGLTGQSFPTPFSGGPGTLSSAVVNIIWGMFNVLVGVSLLRLIRPWKSKLAVRIVILVCAAAFGLMLAWAFSSVPVPAV